ncbi:MAG: NADH-quinone oxidoreductase subunit N [Myxococcota bacterium]
MTPTLDIGALAPMLPVALAALLLPLAEVLLSRRRTFLSGRIDETWIGNALAVGCIGALVVSLSFTAGGFADPIRVFNPDHPMIAMDRLSLFLDAVILIGALITVLVSSRYLDDMSINHGEYYALLMSSVLGMMFLVASTDLIMLFVSLELMSIPIYVLAGFRRRALRSNEAALKYLLIGSFASGILLYGSALLYGATGSFEIHAIAAAFDPESPLALVGAGMVLIGIAFKISAVPFHQWAPDVYEGSPTSVSGFMATAVKVAAFGVLLRVAGVALEPGRDVFYAVLWTLAILSMTVGNLMALIQRNTKRMLAYSSVAHAGYLLVGVVAGTLAGYSAVLFYLFAYTFMTLGAFGVIAVLAHKGEERERIADLTGLAQSRPFLAAVMALCMFSLAGIPGTAGFMGKWYLFWSAVERGSATSDSTLLWLAIIGVLNSALSLGYYLRIPVVMYMRDPTSEKAPLPPGFLPAVALLGCSIAVVLVGLWPESNLIVGKVNLLEWATLAGATLRP